MLRALGDLHLRSVLERMAAQYKLEIDTRPPRIPYRETVAGQAEATHRHKKQTGGAGQFGEVSLRLGEVLVRVAYSTLNYKDGLALTGKGKVLRASPLAPGIDFAGTVLESASPAYRPGDEVLLTGWGVGERHWGGFSQLNRVPAEWLVPLPPGMSLRQSMAVGTAGFTAMLCVLALVLGGASPDGAICQAVMGGHDTDCNGATVGSVVGARAGVARFGGTLAPRLHDTVCPSVIGFSRVTMKELAERTLAQFRRVDLWHRSRGPKVG